MPKQPPVTSTRIPMLKLKDCPPRSSSSAGPSKLTDTFAGLKHSKVVGGKDHPDVLVESKVMSDTQLPALKIEEICIDPEVVKSGWLSSLQLETVSYALQRYDERLPNGRRAGYCLGDGTGCGKGRVIAALIVHLWNRGIRRHIWVSASGDLELDAARDLADLGASHIPLLSLSRVKSYGPLDGTGPAAEQAGKALGQKREGVLFLTYSMLVSERAGDRKAKQAGAASAKDSAKSALDPKTSRMGQVFAWLGGKTTSGLVCFDEAHKAKNLSEVGVGLCSSKTAERVVLLQQQAGDARVLYSTATAATEVKHLGYMERLGLWGEGSPHRCFTQFREAVEKGGVSGMELVALQMKSRGMLSCKALSFQGVTFEVTKAPLNKTWMQRYDAAARFWQLLWNLFSEYLDKREDDKDTTWGFGGKVPAKNGKPRSSRWKSLLLGMFWSTQQRFFKQMQVAAKVPMVVAAAKKAVKGGEAVVFSLWATSEARTKDHVEQAQKTPGDSGSKGSNGRGTKRKLDADAENSGSGEADGDGADEEDDFLSGPQLMVEHFLKRHMSYTRPSGKEVPWAKALVKRAEKALAELDLPPNPLDTLIDELGGPAHVAEMTGRSNRFERDGKGSLVYRKRVFVPGASTKPGGDTTSAPVNVQEQWAFQRGEKHVAVITEAASAGISLHADRRQLAEGRDKPCRRVMMTVELPWAADKAKQQFGRVHRSNQLLPPRFELFVTDLTGEVRFVSAVARRLMLLGAMTKGDRRASEALDQIGEFDVHNRHGSLALEALCECLRSESFRGSTERQPFLEGTKWRSWKAFAAEAGALLKGFGLALGYLERRQTDQSSLKDPRAISRFLNRLLMLEVDMQKALFGAFCTLYQASVEEELARGEFVDGAVQLHMLHRRRVNSLKVTERKDLPGKGRVASAKNSAVSSAVPQHLKIKLDRGISWAEAEKAFKSEKLGYTWEGFHWISGSQSSGKRMPLLVLGLPNAVMSLAGVDAGKGADEEDGGKSKVLLLQPHLGPSCTWEGTSLTAKRLKSLELEKVEGGNKLKQLRECWEELFTHSKQRTVHLDLLAGNVLDAWMLLANSMDGSRPGPGAAATGTEAENSNTHPALRRTMPLARAITDDGEVLLGIVVRSSAVQEVQYVQQQLALHASSASASSSPASTSSQVIAAGARGASEASQEAAANNKEKTKVRESMIATLKKHAKSGAPWGNWCDVHAELLKAGGVDSSPRALRAVYDVVAEMSASGALSIDPVKRLATFSATVPLPYMMATRAMQGAAGAGAAAAAAVTAASGAGAAAAGPNPPTGMAMAQLIMNQMASAFEGSETMGNLSAMLQLAGGAAVTKEKAAEHARSSLFQGAQRYSQSKFAFPWMQAAPAAPAAPAAASGDSGASGSGAGASLPTFVPGLTWSPEATKAAALQRRKDKVAAKKAQDAAKENQEPPAKKARK